MKKTFTLITPAIAILFCSCSVNHYMYAPSAPQSPMLNSKGEMSLTGLLTTGLHARDTGYNNGYDVQGAYAISNHLAITAAFSQRHEKDKYWHNGWFTPQYNAQLWYERSTTELGMGYFTSIDSDDEVFFDLYGGYGFGKYRMHEQGDATGTVADRYHTSSVGKFFLQPGVHFNVSEMSQISLSLRFSTVNYHAIKSDYTKDQETTFNMYSLRNTVYTYADPCFALRLWVPRSPWIKLETQFSVGIKLTKQILYYRSANLSMGLSFDLSKLSAHNNYKPKKSRRKPASFDSRL